MKLYTQYLKLFVTLIMGMSALVLTAGEAKSSEVAKIPSKEKWSQVTLKATVVGIDYATHEVTLRGEKGDMVTLEVSHYATRLKEVKIGDKVIAAFLTMMRAEFREPTAKELENPLTFLSEGEKASLVEDPGLVVGSMAKAVVTIMNINREEQLVTIMGPLGNYSILPVEDKTVLAQRSVGELVIMTYAEASAITIEKMDRE